MSFDLEVKNYTKVALEDAHKVVKKVVNTAMVDTVDKTPVDTGKLKNSWYASFASPIFSTGGRLPDGEEAADSFDSVERVTSKIDKSKIGEPIYLVNSLIYANDIELGASGKAPAGMMRRAMRNAVKDFK